MIKIGTAFGLTGVAVFAFATVSALGSFFVAVINGDISSLILFFFFYALSLQTLCLPKCSQQLPFLYVCYFVIFVLFRC